MGMILDALLLLLIAATAWRSARRGFVRTVIELVGFILAFSIAGVAGTFLANTLYDNAVGPSLQTKVQTAITETLQTDAGQLTNEVNDALPSYIQFGAQTMGLTDQVRAQLQQNIEGGAEKAAKAVTQTVARPVVTGMLRMVFTAVLFMVLLFVVRLAARLLNRMFSFSLIGTLNRLLGGLFGCLKGAVLAAVLCIVVGTVVAITENGFLFFTSEAIESSYLFRFFAGFSPFY